jgi:hypothetical protein
MTKRKLPLESPNWWPIADALEHRSQQTGSNKLATLDFNQALKDRDRPLRSQVRRADGSRELLAAAAWGGEDLHCSVAVRVLREKPFIGSGGVGVFSHKLQRRSPHWFYVWKPDYEKIFSSVTASTEPRTQPREVPVERGRKPVHDRAELQSVALWLATRQKHGAPQKTRANVVDELRDWCTRNKRKAPADSTLYDIVAAAFRLKPTLKD